MGKGSSGGTNTVVQQSQPPQQFLNAYQNVVNQAQNVASQPYTPYPGQIVANMTPAQNQAINEISNTQGVAQPYINAASNYYANVTQPLYQTVGSYESPYVNDVASSTEAQLNNQNAIQQQGIVGNAAAQGAWGGDRSAVAQALTAGQQQLNEAPTIANLYNTGYNTALGAAEAQGWLGSQAGAGTAALGAEALNANLTGANALYNAGAAQQAQQQSLLNVPYYQYLAEQAYPFQTTGFLANIAEGAGAGAGGTSSTTSPGPSVASQLLGTGIGAAGLLNLTGAFGSTGYLSGLFGGGASAATAATDFSGGADFAGSALAGLAGLRRGGAVPHRASGGTNPGGGIAPSTPPMTWTMNGQLPTVNFGNSFGQTPSGGTSSAGSTPSWLSPILSASAPSTTSNSLGIQPVANWTPTAIPSPYPGQSSTASASPAASSVAASSVPLPGYTGTADPYAAPGTEDYSLFLNMNPTNSGSNKRGGAVHGYDDGGAVIGDTPYQQMPILSGIPQIGISVIPTPRGTGIHGMGVPHAPQGLTPGTSPGGMNADTSPAGLLKLIQTLKGNGGLFGGNTTTPTSARGGMIRLATGGIAGNDAFSGQGGLLDALTQDQSSQQIPSYDDGGDITAGLSVDPDLLKALNLTSTAPAQGVADSSGNWEVQHNNFAGMRNPNVPAAGGPKTNPEGWQQFATPEAGIAAISHQLDRYASGATTGKPLSTLNDIVSTWAPSSENDTQKLISQASKIVGVKPDQPIDLSNPGMKAALIEAMIRGEQGGALPVDRATIDKVVADPDQYYQPSNGISRTHPGVQVAQTDTGTMTDAGPSVGIVPRASSVPSSAVSNGIGGSGMSPGMLMALVGFGIASGRSPYPLQNIGAGALEGLKLLQQQKLAQPELALKSAQAEQAQMQTENMRAMRDYYAGKNSNPMPVVSQLDSHLGEAQKTLGNSGETMALPSLTGGAIAPLNPAGNAQTSPIPLMTPEEQKTEALVRGQIGQLDSQIGEMQGTLRFVTDPNALAIRQNAIANLVARRSEMIKELPSYIRTAAYGQAEAQNPALIQRAGGEEQARAANEPQTYVTPGPQGATIEHVAPRGQVMAGNAPGMTGNAADLTPATENGKYDPESGSLVPTQPPVGQGVTKVNLTPAQEDKLKEDAKEIGDYRQQAQQTPVTMQRVQQLSDIIHQLNTGPIAEHGYELMRYAHALGWDSLIPDNYRPQDVEEVNKLATALVFEQLKSIGGRPMVQEIQGLQKANPSVALTPEANLAILSNIAGEAKYTQDRYLNASRVFSKYGQLGNFDQKYIENSPIKGLYDNIRSAIQSGAPPMPGAFQGSDKQWYVYQNGKPFRLTRTPQAVNP